MRRSLGECRKLKLVLYATCLFAVSMGITSCSGLKSKYYPGEKMVIPEGQLSDESIWMCEGEAYYVMRTESNTYAAATLKWDKKKNAYSVISYELVPSKIGNQSFLSVKDNDLYTLFYARFDGGDSVVAFRVNREKMVRDIADGLVNAHADEHDVFLDGSKEEQDEYISKNIDSMFSMESASFAKKISEKQRPEEPAPAEPAE